MVIKVLPKLQSAFLKAGSCVRTNSEMISKFIRAPRLAGLDEIKLTCSPHPRYPKEPVSQASRLFDKYIHTNTLFCDHKTSCLGKTQNDPLLFVVISKWRRGAPGDVCPTDIHLVYART